MRRTLKAAGYSLAGFKAALSEASFRLELILSLILVPLGLYLGKSAVERAMMVGSVILVLVVELLNSSIEAVVDRVSLEKHELSRRAKDIGSAAVALAIVNVVVIWLLLLV